MQEISLHDEVAAFLAAQASLAKTEKDPWVVFANAAFKRRFANFEDAYEYAANEFPEGTFLIRNLHGEDPFIPLMYVPG